ncbi:histone H1-like repetitive region-containing protein [Nitriliruptor alkaliphilus]|uniref:histone H1-like repetitive region-containing protein n=1 Tax=Nitriliruptor alkaliphilus TaxID=427918 RepID=UPI0009F8CDCC|nr:histone H1-like repetitive region-containing protein [Nitriliruptor alkaliphilus]
MIFLSLVLVIVAAVTLVLGVFQDGLVLIYVSIATCVAAMAVLGAGVLLRRREEASAGPAGYGDVSPTRDGGAAVARTPVAIAGGRREAATDADVADVVDERQTAVVRKVEATPTIGDDNAAFRRPAAAGAADTAEVPTSAAGGAADAGVAAGAAARAADEQDPVRPVAKRAVVKRTRTAAATAPSSRTAAKEPAVTDAAEAEATLTPTPTAKKATTKQATAKKATAKKATAKKATAKKATAKKATAKKATAKKATAKKATAKKATAKKATAKKATAKKATAKKATAKKATAKKATAKKATAKKATASGRSASDLVGVRGLGPAKRDKLVARFGSIDAVAAASVEDLSAVPGIGEGTARAIKDALR